MPPLPSKPWPVFNVKDYGAQGDDSTNDTTAIAAAVTAASVAATSSRMVRLFFPDGIYQVDSILVASNIWFDFGNATIKKRSSTSTPIVRTLRTVGVGGYGTYSDIKITGGRIDGNGFTTANGLVGLAFVTRLEIDGVTVVHNAANADWAFAVGGRAGRVTNCRVLGGTVILQDGIHLLHGQDWVIADNYVESGDDAIVCGGETVDAQLAANPDPIRRVTATNNVVYASHGCGFKAYVVSGATGTNWEVTDVTVQGLTGRAGESRNGGVFITDLNDTNAGTSQIKRVKVGGVNLILGSTGHDDTNPDAIRVYSAIDVSLSDLSFTVTDGTGATLGFQLCTVNKSQNVSVDRIACDALGKRYGAALTASERVSLTRSKLVVGTSANGPVYVSAVKFVRIEGNELSNIPTGQYGITVSATSGATTTGWIKGNRFHNSTTSATGVLCPVTAFQRLIIEDNDFTEVATPIDSYTTVRLGQSTTTTATATSSGTSLTVADSSVFQVGDSIFNVRTREWMRVTTLTDGTHIAVVRARRDSTGIAVASGDLLKTFRLITANNRALVNHDPIKARDESPGQAGVFVLPPGFVGQIGSQSGSSNNGRIARFKPPYDMVVTKIGFGVSAWSAGDTADPAMCAAIYDAQGNRLGTTGALTGNLNSTGPKSAALLASVTLLAGQVYYVGVSVGALGTSTVSLSSTSAGSAQANQAFGASVSNAQVDSAASVHPLPDPWVWSGSSSVGFLTWVLEQ